MKELYFRPVLVDAAVEDERLAQLVEDLGANYLPVASALAPLLNGSNALEEICGQLLAAGFDHLAIFRVLQWLDERGMIREQLETEGNPLSVAERRFYRSQIEALGYLFKDQGVERLSSEARVGISAQLKLKRAVVVLIGLGAAGFHLARALALAGIGNIIGVGEGDDNRAPGQGYDGYISTQTREELQRANLFVNFVEVNQVEDLPVVLGESLPDLLIYCSDRFDDELCEWLNNVSLDNSIPLLICRQGMAGTEIGPLVVPNNTACYVCYDRRRKAIDFTEKRVSGSKGSDDSPQLCIPFGIDLIALEVIKFFTGVAEPVTRGRVWQLNILSGRMEVHCVLKLPRCPACGVHKVKPARRLWEEQ